MALNCYMHPRNIYKTPPDFAKLAKMYPEFSSITKMDISGKVAIDFKDPHSLRILTKYLLKSDFGLNIDIPEDRLVPTLPLRLNYILWVEDLLLAIKKCENVWGMDIGTGACAIYPILAATKNQWNMIGTETDVESLQKAQQNIDKNDLSKLIKIRKNVTSSIVQQILDDEPGRNFDFCMCNPPFYSSLHELCESRNPSRPPPKNGFTGSPQELVTEGGELEFCRKLLVESKFYKDRIKIYTTMVGHKYNLKELLLDLTNEGIKHTYTEFCQGRVTRWGLAWTYEDYDIHKLVPPRDKVRKKNVPIAYKLPDLSNNLDTCSDKIKEMLNELQIENKILNKRGQSVSMHIKALKNTWSHQRRKRRLLRRQEECTKKIKLDLNNGNDSITQDSSEKIHSTSDLYVNHNNNDRSLSLHCETNDTLSQEPCEINDSTSQEPLLQAFLKMYKKDDTILLEVEFLNGNAGKEGLHQILQYIKNNYK